MLFISTLAVIAIISTVSSQSTTGVSHHEIALNEQTYSNYLDVQDMGIREMNRVKQRYGNGLQEIIPPIKRKMKRAGSVGSQNITDGQADVRYYTSVIIGGQNLQVILDTGSSELWVASSGCKNCGSTPLYDPKLSKTSSDTQRDFTVVYGSGVGSGELLKDVVQIGGFPAISQNFGAVTNTAGVINSYISGILGLGTLAGSRTYTVPLIQSLSNSGMLNENLFGIGLRRMVNVTGSRLAEQPGGIFTIGGTNTSLYNDTLNYVLLSESKSGHWDIPLDNVSVNGKNLSISSAGVVIDTGTSLIAAPQSVCEAIYSQIPGSLAVTIQGQSGLYSVLCNSSTTVSLTFGGISYSMDPVDFTSQPIEATGTYCLGAFFVFQSSSNIDWIIGAAFLKNVYSSFRFSPNAAVGFAPITRSSVFNVQGNNTAPNKPSSANRQVLATSSLILVAGVVCLLV